MTHETKSSLTIHITILFFINIEASALCNKPSEKCLPLRMEGSCMPVYHFDYNKNMGTLDTFSVAG